MTTLNYTIEQLKVWTLQRQLDGEILKHLTNNSENIELLLEELNELVNEHVFNEITGSEHFYTLFNGISLISGLDLYDQLHKNITIKTSLEKTYDETDKESEVNLANEGWTNLNDVDVYLWSYRIDIEVPTDFFDMINVGNILIKETFEYLASLFGYGIYINSVAFESYGE